MKDTLVAQGAETVALFCRQNVNAKKELPLRPSEIGLLLYTAKAKTPVTPVMAADYFMVSKPRIAAMVKSLHAKGYLIKKPFEKDRRSFLLCPTPKALQLTESVYEEYFKVMRRLLAGMGTEKYQSMIALLQQANQILRKGER